MKKRKLGIILSCGILAALALTLTAAASQFTWDRPEEGIAPGVTARAAEPGRTAAVMMIPQTQGVHLKYMNGDEQGLFQPEKALTRGELAQILYEITVDRPAAAPGFLDVPGDAWYAQAAQAAVGLGLMTDDLGYFRPSDPATRAECACALSQLLPYDAPLVDAFTDVWPGYWAYQAICRTAGQGLFYGDGTGEFRPNDSLSRCEAVTVFNRLLGRSPDLQTLSVRTDLYAFPDVPRGHWAYGEVMEAAVTHQYAGTATGAAERWTSAVAEAPAAAQPVADGPRKDAEGLPDGPQRIDGHLCWVVDGVFTKSCKMDGLAFDENGWYTTGDAELDEMLNSVVNELVDESMTRDEQLRVLYDYVVKNYTYLARPLVSKGAKGWEPEYAKFFLKNGKGNCFSYAAAYCLLCQELGLPAYTVVGTSGGSAHGWVEIFLDGNTYMFDPELQWYYNNKTSKNFNLFKMLPARVPSGVYRYAW